MEAASGKRMWNTALARLSFERTETRQLLGILRSQLTHEMHNMINVGVVSRRNVMLLLWIWAMLAATGITFYQLNTPRIQESLDAVTNVVNTSHQADAILVSVHDGNERKLAG